MNLLMMKLSTLLKNKSLRVAFFFFLRKAESPFISFLHWNIIVYYDPFLKVEKGTNNKLLTQCRYSTKKFMTLWFFNLEKIPL